jgi:orotidine-5'-phosphate decarboxylase
MTKEAGLIVALDVETLTEVRELVEQLGDIVEIFKVGSQLFTSCGPAAVRYLEAKGKKVFLDLKFHDIPNTVANAVASAVNLSEAVERSAGLTNKKAFKTAGLFMYTLHTLGGVEMMKSAVLSSSKQAEKTGVTRPWAVGVTVLTSEEKKDNILQLVLDRAELAKQAGLDGVVASVEEAAAVRKTFGNNFIIVTPGIRPKGADVGDQKRVATPADAIRNGSDYLVVGRPVVKARDPRKAAQNILKEIDQALK